MSEKLAEVLEAFSIEYKTNARSFIMKDCPSCGRSKNTVWMFRPEGESTRTGGQCWVCGDRFSTYSYIVGFGYDAKEVRKSLGIGRYSPDLNPESWVLPDFSIEEGATLNENLIAQEAPVPEHFMKVYDWFNHPAAIYARSRGLVDVLGRQAWIDPLTNSVAFAVETQGVRVGFQRRFVDPEAFLKTKTDAGVPRARSFIKFGTIEQPICAVEGPFDAVAACWFGYYGVCTMGSHISRTQAQELAIMAHNQNPENPKVYIGFDKDSAGESGARDLARLLDAFGVTFERVTSTREFHDFSDALTNGSGLDFLTQEEMLNIHGLVEPKPEWHWSSRVLDGFQYKIGIDYTWRDFRDMGDATAGAEKRRKALNKMKSENPGKYRRLTEEAKLKRERRQKRLELEGLT